MRLNFRAAVVALTLGLIAVSAPSQNTPGTAPMPAPMASMGRATRAPANASRLTITFGPKSEPWTPEKLRALPQTTIKVYDAHVKATETYAGVPVIDLLARLGVPDKPRGKQFLLYLIAAGSDGYQVVYSLGEVAPDVHEGTVIVADSMDGKPLGADGPFKIVSTEEKRPARWVRNLVSIRVLSAQ